MVNSFKTAVSLWMLAFQFLGLVGGIDYCQDVRNCAHLKNIVCLRDNDCGPIEECDEVTLKRSTKIYILLSLNEFRNDVALGHVKGFPNASDMVMQYWDDDLEFVTRCSQNMCKRQDAVCANTVEYSQTIVLQNILSLQRVKDEVDFFRHTIRAWTNPGGVLTGGQIDTFTDPSATEYAAVLWCNSPAIGCALSKDSKRYYGACTFAFAPKMGEHVYRAGMPCSGCPPGVGCNEEYHGLCGDIMLPRSENGGNAASFDWSLASGTFCLVTWLGSGYV